MAKIQYDQKQAQRFVSEDTDFVRILPADYLEITAQKIKAEQLKQKLIEEIKKRKKKER